MKITNPRVTREVVFDLPDVKFTNTWHPISHRDCIQTLENVTNNLNIKIQKEFYSLSEDGQQIYGAWALSNGDNKKIGKDTLFQSIIFRNATNKYYSFGINGGTEAYVCENLVIFCKEFIEFRRHTKGLNLNELYNIVKKGVINLLPKLDEAVNWHKNMHLVKLTDNETRALAYDAIHGGVISKHRIPQFHNLLFEEENNYNPNELFGFHGAITETMRDMRMTGGFNERQMKLNDLINNQYGNQLGARK